MIEPYFWRDFDALVRSLKAASQLDCRCGRCLTATLRRSIADTPELIDIFDGLDQYVAQNTVTCSRPPVASRRS